MPSIINCPSCAGQLRLPETLLGQEVRCPSCNNVFTPAAASEPPPPPAESRPPAPDLSLENGAPAAPRGLVGAVELKLSLDEESAPARAPAAPPPRPSPPPERDRGDDSDTDLRSCPKCGKQIHRDSSRCYGCGWRNDGEPRRWRDEREERDWERGRDRDRRYDRDRDRDRDSRYDRGRREPERRDREPHRGVMILVLGILSLLCIVLVFVPLLPAVGVILGLVAWVMGQGDRKKMAANEMDPDGAGLTTGGWVCGMIGTGINTLLMLSCLAFFGTIIANDYSRPANTNKQPVQFNTNKTQDGPPGQFDDGRNKGMRKDGKRPQEWEEKRMKDR